MANEVKDKAVRILRVSELKRIVRQMVRDELRKVTPLYFVDKDGTKVSLIRDEEAKLKVKPRFKKSLRNAAREVKGGKTATLEEVRRRLKV